MTSFLIRYLSGCVCLLPAFALAGGTPVADPLTLYLTWQQDPTTTMTVHWHTEGATGAHAVEVKNVNGEWESVAGTSREMPYSSRWVWTAELTGLQPAAMHAFRLLDAQQKASRTFHFRTMPQKLDRPLRIAMGGDVRHEQAWMEELNREAVRFDPDFVVWGGDLAYADGREDQLYRWIEFFDAMATLIDENGRVVPVLAGIGNHEVQGGRYWSRSSAGREGYKNSDAFRERIAPYFYNLFAFPGHPGYTVLDFGDYLSLFFLDTDHTNPVAGEQTAWLESALQGRQHVSHLVPVYHVPAYPSVREFGGPESTSGQIRSHWLPLFEQYGVRVAFENHDHAYKRTVPIRAGDPHPDGIVFFGDGAWGVRTRDVHPVSETWFLSRAENVRHFMLLTLHAEFIDVKALNHRGRLIDHYISAPTSE